MPPAPPPAPETVDVKQLVLSNAAFGPREVKKLAGAIAVDVTAYRTLRDAVGELEAREDNTPASNVRLGVSLFLMGRYNRAIEILNRADGGALAQFYLGKAYFCVEQFEQALHHYDAAKRAGFDGDEVSLAKAETQRLAGRAPEALLTLDNLSGAVEQTAEYLYQRGATVASIGGNPQEVVALFERAVDVDRNHPGALFGLAVENDRYGNDDMALEFYKRSASRFPPHVGTLLNLGLIYEDKEQFERAVQCYQRVLDAFPNHGRAALFLKDAQASGDMFYDEDAQRKRDRMSQVMGIPVTDFELSVRSRNCLQKMGVMTLGDLCRTTEQELLSSKNFGETSLIEIKEMLASKGLKLGQFASERHTPEPFEPESLSPDEQALLSKPISDLSLSVRARKCMIRLGISIVGDLVRKTGDELLECKNFGVTSLNEVRDKLASLGLKLRGD
jgi:DNA-directed RNA polymerase subunit alpha